MYAETSWICTHCGQRFVKPDVAAAHELECAAKTAVENGIQAMDASDKTTENGRQDE